MINVDVRKLPPDPFNMLVSGGIDSIAIAHWLRVKFGRNFSITHFNHNVQEANMEMENSVNKFAQHIGVHFSSILRDEDNHVNFNDTSENGLRQWRLHMMAGMGGVFVTGHHLNDAVENYLSNTFKGSPEHIPINWVTHFPNFTIYHPFLTTSKDSLINYVNDHDLNEFVVEDPTNNSLKFRRNWLRHSIIPSLESMNIGLEKVVRKKFYLINN
jgi:tRNA(Ile)-lysidine synthase